MSNWAGNLPHAALFAAKEFPASAVILVIAHLGGRLA
jgi:hypothetical protein